MTSTGQFSQAEVSRQYIRENAVEINLTGTLPERIAKEVRAYKVITIGEMHGTNEAPAFTFSLVKLLTNKGWLF